MSNFEALSSGRIFQSSDLKKDRGLLDAARDGLARLRDTDGTGLVMMPEADLEELTAVAKRDRSMADVAAEVLRTDLLIRASSPDDRLDPIVLGRWSWLAQFDHDDLCEFVTEMATAIIKNDDLAVFDTLSGWQESAAALADPERMSVLSAGLDEDDYVEVPRPDGDHAVAGSPAVASA